MQNTLVWEIITALSKQEMRDVRQFLASPYFNLRQDVRSLFEALAEAAAKGLGAPGQMETWGKMFPNVGVADDQAMRLIQSYLLKLLEQHLVLKEQENEPLAGAHLLLAAYRRRKLPRHFQKTQKTVQAQLESQPLRNPAFHLASYAVEHQGYLFLSETQRSKELNLQPVEDQLGIAFAAMKLRQACLLRAHQSVFNTAYRLDLTEELLALAATPPYLDAPAVSVYFHCYRALFSEESEENFAAFKDQLFQHSYRFPPAEMRDLYLLALNFCIKKINENQSSYLRQSLDLYKEGLKTALLLEDGKISRFTFNNAVGIALRLKEEWAWAESFMNEYRNQLEPSQQEATFSLNAARLAFARRRFDDALLLLQRADYKDLINSMVAKTLQLKIYFEKGEWELLDAHLRTMRMFIRRNKRMGYHHQNWQNIVRFTQKIMELSPGDDERRALLRADIEAAEMLTEKAWLLWQVQ